ncbi:MAG TPA: hypothetical protein VFN56_01655 [Candidatus Saccharimonadales bacterium]|nr:hypothetical protein [Candidatus Saccharimonadales bacterium]
MQPQQPYDSPTPPQPTLPASAQPLPATPPTVTQPPLPSGNAATPNYDFILNPQKPTRSGVLGGLNFATSSTPKRVLFVAVGIVVLFMAFTVIKGAFSGGNNALPALVGIVQDQQALLNIAASGTQHVTAQNLKNSAYTAQLSLQSDQSQLLTYLKQADGRKVGVKEANLKVSAAITNQLNSALASSTFDSTYSSTMQTQLKAYQQDLQQTYLQEKGPHGRALLSAFYDESNLLLKQLGS